MNSTSDNHTLPSIASPTYITYLGLDPIQIIIQHNLSHVP